MKGYCNSWKYIDLRICRLMDRRERLERDYSVYKSFYLIKMAE